MMRYAVVVEKTGKTYGAYVPDLPGCVAVGETQEEVLGLVRQAIELHIDMLKKDGLQIPLPTTVSEYIEV